MPNDSITRTSGILVHDIRRRNKDHWSWSRKKAIEMVEEHDSNIRAEERKAAAVRVCEDCRRRGNIDCDISDICEIRAAILNKETK